MIGRIIEIRLREERGSAVVEFVTLAVAMLVPLAYLVMLVARIEAGSYAVSMAAREASRTFITSDSRPLAQRAVSMAMEDQGFSQGNLVLACSANPCTTPESRVTARVSASVPLPLVPAFVRGVVPLQVPVSAEQMEIVPKFRGAP